MPRSKDYVYIPVPVLKGSQLYEHLRDEAARIVGDAHKKKQIPIGPYVASLLEDRDRALYGHDESKLWMSTSTPYLNSLIEATVQKVVSTLPTATAPGSKPAEVSPVEVIHESSEEEIDAEAAAFANGWEDE